jgi:hypothetical protein
MYSKTGGKNGKHAAISTTTNISATSRLAVQLFEHITDRQFRIYPSLTSPFQAKGFGLIAPASFLTTLSQPGTAPIMTATSIQISQVDGAVFRKLKAGHSKFQDAAKSFKERGEDSDDEEGSQFS